MLEELVVVDFFYVQQLNSNKKSLQKNPSPAIRFSQISPMLAPFPFLIMEQKNDDDARKVGV